MKMNLQILSAVNPKNNIQAFGELLVILKRHRQLIVELAKREINDRYAGQVFGYFWTFGHPLILIILYAVVFGFIFQANVDGPMNYVVFLLAGLIPWLTFQEVMGKATTLINNNANIVKQVIFPIEVLPIKGVLAAVVTQFVLFFLLVIYIFITGKFPLFSYLLLPVIILIQITCMIGVSFMLCAISPYFRDMKDLVQIFVTVSFFAMPMIYSPSALPPIVKYIFYINPFSYMIWCYQDIVFYGHFQHPWSWVIFSLTSLVAFVFGYRLFRTLKVMFGNVL
jgi:lipopolysaccharide transport system permease protein